ncbi:MAG TPA: molybdopterin-dependent oxidoreductase [Acidimicrobiales bacterium]|nr:molybdopterin-dependent oxidoreductase [Acidimicrobiales bacterium]
MPARPGAGGPATESRALPVPGAPGGGGADRDAQAQRTAVGRRVFLGAVALGAAGIAFGSRVQQAVGGAVGSGLGGLIPGGDRFRLYTITGGFPQIGPSDYRLRVSGLVDRPIVLTLADLQAMPSTKLVRDFQCVTGWRVADVHWEGVRLADVLDSVGVRPGATALAFDSYDGADTESLTLDQARLPDVLVAYRMLGAPITAGHGGPVRLYVARMYGYKSIKWLSAVRVVDRVQAGFWEQNGYPVDAWVGGSMAAATKNIG